MKEGRHARRSGPPSTFPQVERASARQPRRLRRTDRHHGSRRRRHRQPALCFALHTLFTDVADRAWGPLRIPLPDLTSVRPTAFAITAAALFMLFSCGGESCTSSASVPHPGWPTGSGEAGGCVDRDPGLGRKVLRLHQHHLHRRHQRRCSPRPVSALRRCRRSGTPSLTADRWAVSVRAVYPHYSSRRDRPCAPGLWSTPACRHRRPFDCLPLAGVDRMGPGGSHFRFPASHQRPKFGVNRLYSHLRRLRLDRGLLRLCRSERCEPTPLAMALNSRAADSVRWPKVLNPHAH